MKAKLIQIGNSKGVRLPKAVIEQCKLDEEVELEVRNDQVIIRSVAQPRAGWAESYQAMRERSDDVLLDGEVRTTWDDEEWEW